MYIWHIFDKLAFVQYNIYEISGTLNSTQNNKRGELQPKIMGTENSSNFMNYNKIIKYYKDIKNHELEKPTIFIHPFLRIGSFETLAN